MKHLNNRKLYCEMYTPGRTQDFRKGGRLKSKYINEQGVGNKNLIFYHKLRILSLQTRMNLNDKDIFKIVLTPIQS